jgi:CO/xanthine dehydrogenase Mo-binding subunit
VTVHATATHFALEPINALAFEKNGVFEILTGNQWQSAILPVLAKALGRSQDKIVMRSYLLDGGFGRRLDGDYAVPAALAAQAVGRPVKMVCTRADDMRFDCPRSATTQVLRLAWRDDNRVAAMDHHAAAGWPTATIAPYFQLKDAKGTFGQERGMPTCASCAARVRVIVEGQPKDTNLDSYRVLRMGDVPEIEVEFLPSTETPVGLGEPAMTPVAPAIANAIFAATGARVRHLPIRPQAVLEALERGI